MTKNILVTGATGKQGGAVVDALLALNASGDASSPPFHVLAVTRNAQAPAAQRLAARPGVTVVQGDFDDCGEMMDAGRRALGSDGRVWGVFSVQVSLGPQKDGETTQGKALIDAALAAGVSHFVYTSVERGGDEDSWNNATPIPHFQTKHAIEQYLRTTAKGRDMTWTILRPVAFMDNLTPSFSNTVFMAALRNSLGSNSALQWVAVHDIGVFAAKAFERPQDWDGRAVGLAGDELTMTQLSETFRSATGKPVQEAYWFLGTALTWAVKEMGVMIAWFSTDGYHVDIEARRAEHPGLLTMERWIREKSDFQKKTVE